MSNISPHHNIQMHHASAPKGMMLKELGDLSELRLMGIQVLIGVYIRPERTKSGIFLTPKNLDEDRYQSKVGLVLKMGPSAFVDDDGKFFAGDPPKVGDWVVYRPSDGWPITINGVLCRMFSDASVRMQIPHPDAVY